MYICWVCCDLNFGFLRLMALNFKWKCFPAPYLTSGCIVYCDSWMLSLSNVTHNTARLEVETWAIWQMKEDYLFHSCAADPAAVLKIQWLLVWEVTVVIRPCSTSVVLFLWLLLWSGPALFFFIYWILEAFVSIHSEKETEFIQPKFVSVHFYACVFIWQS